MYKSLSMRKKNVTNDYHNRSDENIQKYKKTRRNAKKALSKARGQAYMELYQKLDTK
jgi:lipocalin